MASIKHDSRPADLGRRTFVKWAGALGGAAAIASSPLLKSIEPVAYADEPGEGFVGNSDAALSDGLPYGADKVVPTVCSCGDVCGMLHMGQAYVRDGHIVYYEGCDDAFNTGRLCPRGAAGLQIINSPNRVKYPMRRTNEKGVEGEFERISWDECYDILSEAIATAIEEEGPQTLSCATYHWGNIAGSHAQSVFRKIWNMDNSYGPQSCYSDLMLASMTTMGDAYHVLDADPMQSDLLIFWGENDAVAKPQEWSDSYAKAMKEKGTRCIVIEPRISEIGEKADLYVPVRPGTDAYLALAMANVIIEEGLQNQEFIDEYTYGYDEFKELVARYTPEEVEKVCWTPADMIRQVAREYAQTPQTYLCVGRGGNQTGGQESNSGWMMARAIFCLVGLTGHVGRKGAGISIEASGHPSHNMWFHWPNAMMGIDTAQVEPLVKREEQWASGGRWGQARKLVHQDPCGYRVAMWQNNPAGSAGNAAEMDEALKKIPMVVLVNRFANWTGSGYADILIPISSWAEQTMWRQDWQSQVASAPAIEPMFECKDDFTFYKELSAKIAERLGLDVEKSWGPWDTIEEFIEAHTNSDVVNAEIDKRVAEGKEEFAEWKNCTTQFLIDHPKGMPNPFYAGQEEFVPFKAKNYPDQAPEGMDPEEIFFPTTAGGDYPGDGKLLFRCDWLAERTEGALPVMPVPEEPQDSWYASGNPIESGDWEEFQAVKDGFDLVACGKAHKHWQFIGFNQDKDGGNASPWLREAFLTATLPTCELNPVDAEARGLADGDAVDVLPPFAGG